MILITMKQLSKKSHVVRAFYGFWYLRSINWCIQYKSTVYDLSEKLP